MAFLTSIKSLQKVLSKINKKEAERGGIKMKGNREKKKIQPRAILQAPETAFNLSINIQRTGLCTLQFKRGCYSIYL